MAYGRQYSFPNQTRHSATTHMKAHRILIVTGRPHPFSLFSPTLQAALAQEGVSHVATSYRGALKSMQLEAKSRKVVKGRKDDEPGHFDLIVADEAIPYEPSGEPVEGLGQGLLAAAAKFRAKNFALMASSDVYAKVPIKDMNLKHHGNDLAYIFTVGQLCNGKRSAIERDLFGVVHEADLPEQPKR